LYFFRITTAKTCSERKNLETESQNVSKIIGAAGSVSIHVMHADLENQCVGKLHNENGLKKSLKNT
jgi:hypothetical protein